MFRCSRRYFLETVDFLTKLASTPHLLCVNLAGGFRRICKSSMGFEISAFLRAFAIMSLLLLFCCDGHRTPATSTMMRNLSRLQRSLLRSIPKSWDSCLAKFRLDLVSTRSHQRMKSCDRPQVGTTGCVREAEGDPRRRRQEFGSESVWSPRMPRCQMRIGAMHRHRAQFVLPLRLGGMAAPHRHEDLAAARVRRRQTSRVETVRLILVVPAALGRRQQRGRKRSLIIMILMRRAGSPRGHQC